MQKPCDTRINTVIISSNPELCSNFASHQQFRIIGQYESVISMQIYHIMADAQLLIVEAGASNDDRIEAGREATRAYGFKAIALVNAFSEEAQGSEADSDDSIRIFLKPWNYVQIIDYINSAINNEREAFGEQIGVEEEFIDQSAIRHAIPDNQSIQQFRIEEERSETTASHEQQKKQSGAGKVIVIANPKGGVGKTFLSVNLACELAKDGRQKVALLDTNLGSCDMALQLDMLSAPTMTELLSNGDQISEGEVEQQLPAYNRLPLRVLLGPSTPEMCEFVDSGNILRITELMRKEFEWIVVDTASCSYNTTTFDLLEASDTVIIVTTCDLSSLQQARMLIHLMKRLSIEVEKKVHLVVNRLSADSAVSPSRIEDFLQMKIRGVLPEETNVVSQSILHGNPIVLDNRNEPFKTDLQKLISALNISGKQVDLYNSTPARKSMFDSIRSLIFERKDNYGRRT